MQKEGLGFAVLEAKDFAVAADVEFALNYTQRQLLFFLDLLPHVDVEFRYCLSEVSRRRSSKSRWGRWNRTEAYLAGINLLTAEGVFVGTHDGGR